jgi:lipid II:glycine glycyltransferase (peptidoglycan interpeptide bridge formation enzyme)
MAAVLRSAWGFIMGSWAVAAEWTQLVARPAGLYTVEIDQIDQDGWNRILRKFDDANLLQTWSYGAVRWGRNNLSHVVLRQSGEIVSAAQVVIKTIPLLGAGLAYVKWGPLWQPRGMERNPEALRRLLRELRRVYVNQRGLLLRIFPADTEDGTGALRSLFEEEGFERDLTGSTRQTAVIDLCYSLEDLRSSLKPTWRRNLVLAERNQLSIIHGTGAELFDIFAKLYQEMLDRKRRVPEVSMSRFAEIQRNLPPALKMRVMLCELQGQPIAGLAVPCFGHTALNLLTAATEKGLKLRASYFVQWHMLQLLKKLGCRWYDLDRIDEREHPGITQFKSGFAGKLGLTPEYLGRFEACGRSASRVSVQVGSRVNTAYSRMKRRTQRMGHSVATRLVSGLSASDRQADF